MKYQDLSLYTVPGSFRGRSKVTVQIWWIVQATLFAWSPQVLFGWRRFILRAFGAKIGKNVNFRSSVKITYPWKLTVGDYSWIGDDCVLYSLGEIKIGSHVVISQRSYLNTGGHDYDKIAFDTFVKPIAIENECWITTDVYIAPGVTIGEGTIVSARSSVFKDLPKGKIYSGTPARLIGDRLPALKEEKEL